MNRIIQNIYEDLNELSDLDLQRKLWLNEENDTGHISSYVELFCRLFDDNYFDGFIDETIFELGFSSELILELNKLRDLLNNYEEKEMSDAEIIKDPEWIKISKQAQIVVKLWNNYGRCNEIL